MNNTFLFGNRHSFSQHLEQQFSTLETLHNNTAKFAIVATRREEALREAQAWEVLSEVSTPPLLLSMAVKACIDVQGWVTHAGSPVLSDALPAQADAPLVATLRRLGMVVTLQTNMTEFAYGALGVNPHYGTPRTPLDSQGQRISGGSTSGGAVAVALGLSDLALGTDTSGSVRIPAAFCGVVGFKPSKGRYPGEGIINLSTSFDVPGFIARDARLLQQVDAALAEQPFHQTAIQTHLKGSRFLVPTAFALEGLDEATADAFRHALNILTERGAEIIERPIPGIETYGDIAVRGGVLAAESYLWHRPYLADHSHLYGSRIGPRIAQGHNVMAWEYLQALQELKVKAQQFSQALDGFNALLMPTVPILPPKLDDLDDDDAYYQTNRLVFRLAEVANRIDAPSISLPIIAQQPIGLMLTGHRGQDQSLLQLAVTVQDVLKAASPIRQAESD